MLALEAWAMVGIHVCGTDDMRGCCYSCSSVAVTVACWSVPMAQEVRATGVKDGSFLTLLNIAKGSMGQLE